MPVPATVVAVVNSRAPRLRRPIIDALGESLSGNALLISRSAAAAEPHYRAAVGSGVSALIIGGGDGTIAHGLTWLWRACGGDATRLPAIGVLRLGTGNAAADSVGAPRATARVARALVDRLRRRQPGRSMATLKVLDQLACFCGFGVDAQILEDRRRTEDSLRRWRLEALGRGALGYAISALTRSMPRFLRDRRPRVTIRNLGSACAAGPTSRGAELGRGVELWSGACTLGACAAIPYFGFGLEMFPLATARSDRFQLRAADPGLLEIIGSTPAAFRGRYFSARVHDFLCDHVELVVSEPSPFEVSGDLIGSIDRVEVRLGPRFDVSV